LCLLAKQLIRPTVIDVVNGKVCLVRPIIATSRHKVLPQGLKAMEPMCPLRVTFT
jgi:hypothetical protein